MVGVGFWIWIVSIIRSRKYKYKQPKFALTLFAVVAIILVSAFAGIEPLSSYKDNIINSITNYLDEQQFAQKAADEIREQKETERQIQVIRQAEQKAFELVNKERMLEGLMPTIWDDNLYTLSKAHTQQMYDKGEIFHSPDGAAYGENAWGGEGYSRYDYDEMASVIVASWMSSPLHKAWILHGPLKTSVVSIVSEPNGQYSSWTFWMNESGEGPDLVKKIAEEWQTETGKNIPWIEWLYTKGYLN